MWAIFSGLRTKVTQADLDARVAELAATEKRDVRFVSADKLKLAADWAVLSIHHDKLKAGVASIDLDGSVSAYRILVQGSLARIADETEAKRKLAVAALQSDPVRDPKLNKEILELAEATAAENGVSDPLRLTRNPDWLAAADAYFAARAEKLSLDASIKRPDKGPAKMIPPSYYTRMGEVMADGRALSEKLAAIARATTR